MDDLKLRIKSILLLSPSGMRLHEFLSQFSELSGYSLQPARFGYSDVGSLLNSMPDILYTRGDLICGKNSAATSRITSDIKQQNKPRRRTRTSDGYYRGAAGNSGSYPVRHASYHRATDYYNSSLSSGTMEMSIGVMENRRTTTHVTPNKSTSLSRTESLPKPSASNNMSISVAGNKRSVTSSRCNSISDLHSSTSNILSISVTGDKRTVMANRSNIISAMGSLTSNQNPRSPIKRSVALPEIQSTFYTRTVSRRQSLRGTSSEMAPSCSSAALERSESKSSVNSVWPNPQLHKQAMSSRPSVAFKSVWKKNPPFRPAGNDQSANTSPSKQPLKRSFGSAMSLNTATPLAKSGNDQSLSSSPSKKPLKQSFGGSVTSLNTAAPIGKSNSSSSVNVVWPDPKIQQQAMLNRKSIDLTTITTPKTPTVSWPDPNIHKQAMLNRRSIEIKPVEKTESPYRQTIDDSSSSNGDQTLIEAPSPRSCESIMSLESDISSSSRRASIDRLVKLFKRTRLSSSPGCVNNLMVKDFDTCVKHFPVVVRGQMVAVINKYIILKNRSHMASIEFHTMKIRFEVEMMKMWLDDPTPPSVTDSSWQPGSIMALKSSSDLNGNDEYERVLLLDSFVDEDDNSAIPQSTRKCLVYLFDEGSLRFVSSTQVRLLQTFDHSWVARVPPNCFLLELQNVYLYDEPTCLPLEPMPSSLTRGLKQYIGQTATCHIISSHSDCILPEIYLISSLRFSDSDVCPLTELQRTTCLNEPQTMLLSCDPFEALWYYEPQYCLPSCNVLRIRICTPLQWWPCSSEILAQSSNPVAMVMVQLLAAHLQASLDGFIETLNEHLPSQPVSSIRIGAVYLLKTETVQLRVRVKQKTEESCQVVLLDYAHSRLRSVDPKDLIPYSFPVESQHLCPPFLCRALPVNVDKINTISQFLYSQLDSLFITARRRGIGFDLS